MRWEAEAGEERQGGAGTEKVSENTFFQRVSGGKSGLSKLKRVLLRNARLSLLKYPLFVKQRWKAKAKSGKKTYDSPYVPCGAETVLF